MRPLVKKDKISKLTNNNINVAYVFECFVNGSDSVTFNVKDYSNECIRTDSVFVKNMKLSQNFVNL